MARTIQEIQNELLQVKANESELNDLNSTSRTAIWRLWLYIMATAIWSLEKLFDIHREDINERIRKQKNFRLPWYKEMALNFQYGYGLALVDEADYYDNSNLTAEQIESSKIVKYAAVNEVDNTLVVKIATEKDGELQRITDEQELAFKHYLNRIKAAGVEIRVVNAEPDTLEVDLLIYYDPLLMRRDGSYIDGTSQQPVKDALKEYLKQLPFNGELVLEHLTDHLQKVKGVVIPHLLNVKSGWLDNAPRNIEVRKIPESGYFKINESKLNILYEPNI